MLSGHLYFMTALKDVWPKISKTWIYLLVTNRNKLIILDILIDMDARGKKLSLCKVSGLHDE